MEKGKRGAGKVYAFPSESERRARQVARLESALKATAAEGFPVKVGAETGVVFVRVGGADGVEVCLSPAEAGHLGAELMDAAIDAEGG